MNDAWDVADAILDLIRDHEEERARELVQAALRDASAANYDGRRDKIAALNAQIHRLKRAKESFVREFADLPLEDRVSTEVSLQDLVEQLFDVHLHKLRIAKRRSSRPA